MSTGYHRLLSRPLMLKRTLRVAELFNQIGDWGEVRRIVFGQNIFQCENENTINADYSEIKRRLLTLSPAALQLISQTPSETAKIINLIAIYNVYPLFRDFMSEFVYGRFLSGNRELVPSHFHHFLEEMKFRHEELRHKGEITVKKGAGFIFQILRETGLINGETVISPFLPWEVTSLPELADPVIRKALLK